MKCRNCQHEISQLLVDLESSPPSNSFLSKDDLDRPETYYPLKVMVCDKCFLVQIDEYKASQNIFDENYIYFSSISKSWLDHARLYSDKMIELFKLNSDSFVVEVASNDGYLLKNFKAKNIRCLGVDPTKSTADVARSIGIETVESFFSDSVAKELSAKYGKADLVAANNVLAHVPNLHDFVEGFRNILKPNGVVTLEFPHLMELVQNNQFDTIYHEHFSYLSFTTVCSLLEQHGMRVFKVEQIETHGGSLRVYGCNQDADHVENKNVSDLLRLEESKGMRKLDYYKDFQKKAEELKFEFIEFLINAKKKNLKVAGYGAAAKGNTFINYSGITKDLLSFVVDASPHKQGKFLPGSRIPVYSLTELTKFNPDFIIIFPWNIKKEIMKQLKSENLKSKYVTFIPKLEILET